jgi:hypothetical protein
MTFVDISYGIATIRKRVVNGEEFFAAFHNGAWIGGELNGEPRQVFRKFSGAGRAITCAMRNAGLASPHKEALTSQRAQKWANKKVEETVQEIKESISVPTDWDLADRVVRRAYELHCTYHGLCEKRSEDSLFPRKARGLRKLQYVKSLSPSALEAAKKLYARVKDVAQGRDMICEGLDMELAMLVSQIPVCYR